MSSALPRMGGTSMLSPTAGRSRAVVARSSGDQTDSGAVEDETEAKLVSECETGGKILILQLEKLRVSKSNRFKMPKSSVCLGGQHRTSGSVPSPFGRRASAMHPTALRKIVHHPTKRETKINRVTLKPSRLSSGPATFLPNDKDLSPSSSGFQQLLCKKCSPYASADTTNPYIHRFPCHCKKSRVTEKAAVSEPEVFGSRASQPLQDFSACCKELSSSQTMTLFRSGRQISGVGQSSFTNMQSRAQKRARCEAIDVAGTAHPQPEQHPTIAASKSTCAQEAMEPNNDVSVDDLAGYLDNLILPKKMSYMAEMMYT